MHLYTHIMCKKLTWNQTYKMISYNVYNVYPDKIAIGYYGRNSQRGVLDVAPQSENLKSFTQA